MRSPTPLTSSNYFNIPTSHSQIDSVFASSGFISPGSLDVSSSHFPPFSPNPTAFSRVCDLRGIKKMIFVPNGTLIDLHVSCWENFHQTFENRWGKPRSFIPSGGIMWKQFFGETHREFDFCFGKQLAMVTLFQKQMKWSNRKQWQFNWNVDLVMLVMIDWTNVSNWIAMESGISFQHGPVLATWLRISGPFDIVRHATSFKP